MQGHFFSWSEAAALGLSADAASAGTSSVEGKSPAVAFTGVRLHVELLKIPPDIKYKVLSYVAARRNQTCDGLI